MKILVCDYSNALETDYRLTERCLKDIFAEAGGEPLEFAVKPYIDEETLIRDLDGVSGLITGFLEIGGTVFSRTPDLKCVSVSGIGYANIDVQAAQQYGVTVCHIAEYCTREVAEHTMALLLGLNRHLKYYTARLEKDHEWKYHTIAGENNLAGQCLAVFGFGKIGRQVAQFAKAFGMEIITVDPYVPEETLAVFGAERVTFEEALSRADVLTLHMNLTEENYHMFDKSAFAAMKKHPLFLNVGRGGLVSEEALVWALDNGLIRGAGLDVLEDENPDLTNNPLLGRDNVILTPHSAFYSAQSIGKLQSISAQNAAYFLTGQKEKVSELVWN